MSLILIFKAVTNAYNKPCQPCSMYFTKLLSFLVYVCVCVWGGCVSMWGCELNKYLDVKIKSLIMQRQNALSMPLIFRLLSWITFIKIRHWAKFFDEVRNISKCNYMYFKKRFTVFVQAMYISTFTNHFRWEMKLFLSMINISLSRSKYFC